MNNEYVIINKTEILKRIEELNYFIEIGKETNPELVKACELRIDELNIILSQSTPLIPVVERAYIAGEQSRYSRIGEAVLQQDYISNLKLDI